MQVTAADGTTTNTYTVTVMHEPASTDATLSALSLSSGTLSPDVLVGAHELQRLGGDHCEAHHGVADDERRERHR